MTTRIVTATAQRCMRARLAGPIKIHATYWDWVRYGHMLARADSFAHPRILFGLARARIRHARAVRQYASELGDDCEALRDLDRAKGLIR